MNLFRNIILQPPLPSTFAASNKYSQSKHIINIENDILYLSAFLLFPKQKRQLDFTLITFEFYVLQLKFSTAKLHFVVFAIYYSLSSQYPLLPLPTYCRLSISFIALSIVFTLTPASSAIAFLVILSIFSHFIFYKLCKSHLIVSDTLSDILNGIVGDIVSDIIASNFLCGNFL